MSAHGEKSHTEPVHGAPERGSRPRGSDGQGIVSRSMAGPLDPSKRILVYVNGDKHRQGTTYIFRNRQIRTWDGLLGDLSARLKPRFGAIRRVFTPVHGTEIKHPDQLKQDGIYVVAGTDKLRARHQGYPPEHEVVQEKPFAHLVNPGRLNRETYKGVPKVLPTYFSGDSLSDIRTHPRVIMITVFRNGDDVNPPINVTLKRFDLWNMTRAKDAIGEKIRPLGGFVHSLKTLNGKTVKHVTDLQNGAQYVVLGQAEKFRRVDYEPAARREMFIPISTYKPRKIQETGRRRFTIRLKKRSVPPNKPGGYEQPVQRRASPVYKEPQAARRSQNPSEERQQNNQPKKRLSQPRAQPKRFVTQETQFDLGDLRVGPSESRLLTDTHTWDEEDHSEHKSTARNVIDEITCNVLGGDCRKFVGQSPFRVHAVQSSSSQHVANQKDQHSNADLTLAPPADRFVPPSKSEHFQVPKNEPSTALQGHSNANLAGIPSHQPVASITGQAGIPSHQPSELTTGHHEPSVKFAVPVDYSAFYQHPRDERVYRDPSALQPGHSAADLRPKPSKHENEHQDTGRPGVTPAANFSEKPSEYLTPWSRGEATSSILSQTRSATNVTSKASEKPVTSHDQPRTLHKEPSVHRFAQDAPEEKPSHRENEVHDQSGMHEHHSALHSGRSHRALAPASADHERSRTDLRNEQSHVSHKELNEATSRGNIHGQWSAADMHQNDEIHTYFPFALQASNPEIVSAESLHGDPSFNVMMPTHPSNLSVNDETSRSRGNLQQNPHLNPSTAAHPGQSNSALAGHKLKAAMSAHTFEADGSREPHSQHVSQHNIPVIYSNSRINH